MAGLRFPSIDGLLAFEAAARLGSFERAADELAVTASAVSKRVAALEELLGAPVFSRAAKALMLTASGRDYLQQVQPALALLAAAPQHHRAQQRRQKLRISTPPTFARLILVPALEAFTQLHPDVDLEVVMSIPYLASQGVNADLEIRFGDPGDNPVLLKDPVLPMAAPALLQRLPAMRDVADLGAAPLLRTPILPWKPWFEAAGLDWPEPTQGPRLVDLGLTLDAAVSGQGVALALPTLARTWLANGSLVPLFDLAMQPASVYHLGTAAVTREAQPFAQWLLAVCAAAMAEARALLPGLSLADSHAQCSRPT